MLKNFSGKPPVHGGLPEPDCQLPVRHPVSIITGALGLSALLVSIAAVLTGCSTAGSDADRHVIDAENVASQGITANAPQAETGPVATTPGSRSPLPALTISARLVPTAYGSLPGWTSDDAALALPALQQSCLSLRRRPGWLEVCDHAAQLATQFPSANPESNQAVRNFFETSFQPYRILDKDGETSGILTSYYEPVLTGSLRKTSVYNVPLLKAPNDLVSVELGSQYPELASLRLRGKLVGNKVVPFGTRADITARQPADNDVVVWLDDPVDAFFLQVQGSGVVKLNDQQVMRVAYSNQNGYPYKSIGKYLVDQGELTLAQASAQGIKKWAKQHPARLRELLNANPSYIFFKGTLADSHSGGPVGALGVPLTDGRSVAIDSHDIPLGVPLFLSATAPGEPAYRRLVLAQDTGSAIKGGLRADLFAGTGNDAGDAAGKTKHRNEMWMLLPKGLLKK